jgi:hypothetical protein
MVPGTPERHAIHLTIETYLLLLINLYGTRVGRIQLAEVYIRADR